jgi:hypothetical protein
MRDRWDEDEEELGGGRGRSRRSEPEPEPTLGELIDNTVRRLVTGIVIAGGLIALGTWGAGRGDGGDPSVDYQIATTPDGTLYRVDSENGRILACRNNHCWRLLSDRDDIDDEPPGQNAAAATQPQAVTTQPPTAVAAQPSQAQLPPPQNSAAPAAR